MNTDTVYHLVVLAYSEPVTIAAETFFNVFVPPFHSRHPFIRYIYNDFQLIGGHKYGFTFTSDSPHKASCELDDTLYDIYTNFPASPTIVQLYCFDEPRNEMLSIAFSPLLTDENDNQGFFVDYYKHRQLNTTPTPTNLYNRMARLKETLPTETYIHHFDPDYYSARLQQLQPDLDEVTL